jgi:hypothetical protein
MSSSSEGGGAGVSVKNSRARFSPAATRKKKGHPTHEGVEWPYGGLMVRPPAAEDAVDVGERLFSLVDLVLPGTSVNVPNLRALLIGKLDAVVGSLRWIQSQQGIGGKLRMSRGDRRCRNQSDQSRGAEKKAGVLHVGILEQGHGDVSLLVDALLKAQWVVS